MNYPKPQNSSTTSRYDLNAPRQDFDVEDFNQLLNQKGVSVTVEKALQCPCKSESQNQLSSCQNCGGMGWLFINKKNIRILLTGMGSQKEWTQWSEENKGTINFSCPQDEDISFMDRITRINAESIFNEIIHFQTVEGTTFSYTVYPPKNIDYIAIFVSSSQPLMRLSATDYLVDGNIIILNDTLSLPEGEITATIRYRHAPAFHVIDMKRESMDNYRLENGTEQLQLMPISGVARRAHYIEGFENINGNPLLDNNYDETQC